MTAKQQYDQTRSEINSLLMQLSELLKTKDKLAENDVNNWGYAGDLGYIKEQLTDIVNFLNNNELLKP